MKNISYQFSDCTKLLFWFKLSLIISYSPKYYVIDECFINHNLRTKYNYCEFRIKIISVVILKEKKVKISNNE